MDTLYEGRIELAPTDSTFRDILRFGRGPSFMKTDTIIGKYWITGPIIQFRKMPYYGSDDLVMADYIGDVITIRSRAPWLDALGVVLNYRRN